MEGNRVGIDKTKGRAGERVIPMWAVLVIVGLIVVLVTVLAVWDHGDELHTQLGERKRKQDQDKRDKGELPYDYFRKERRDERS